MQSGWLVDDRSITFPKCQDLRLRQGVRPRNVGLCHGQADDEAMTWVLLEILAFEGQFQSNQNKLYLYIVQYLFLFVTYV